MVSFVVRSNSIIYQAGQSAVLSPGGEEKKMIFLRALGVLAVNFLSVCAAKCEWRIISA
jgi:hypothetical protein